MVKTRQKLFYGKEIGTKLINGGKNFGGQKCFMIKTYR